MSLPWSSKGLKATPVGADELLILDSIDTNPSTKNKRVLISSLPVIAGVTKVGDVPNTNNPEPVSSSITPAS